MQQFKHSKRYNCFSNIQSITTVLQWFNSLSIQSVITVLKRFTKYKWHWILVKDRCTTSNIRYHNCLKLPSVLIIIFQWESITLYWKLHLPSFTREWLKSSIGRRINTDRSVSVHIKFTYVSAIGPLHMQNFNGSTMAYPFCIKYVRFTNNKSVNKLF